MKKSTLFAASIAALFMSSPTNAQTTSPFAGAYVGLKIGGTQSSLKMPGYKKNDINFDGGFLGGYGTTLENIYIGAEAFIGQDTTAIEIVPGIKLKRDFNFGITGRLGFELTPTQLVYLSLGVASEKAKLEVKTGRTVVTGTTQRKAIIVPGIGTQISLTSNLSVRADLNHQLARSFDKDLKLSKTSLMLGLAYRF